MNKLSLWGCVGGLVLLAGCFAPAPCTQDSECGGPGGACDVARGFCVTTSEEDAGRVDAGGADAGELDAGEVDAGEGDAGEGDAGSEDAGSDGGVAQDAGVDAGAEPTVLGTTPLHLATNVAAGANLTVTFSEVMDSASLSTLTFTLAQGATPVGGAVSLAGATATFVPAARLETGLGYTATLTTGARSLGGRALAQPHTWTFTTALLDLGTAQSYSVLGASVGNTGPTSLSGDLGVSTTAPLMGGATITVGGTTHEGDAAATLARADALRAYNAAFDLPPTASLATLDGRTLTAGVYSATAALSLSTVLTLDGQGDPNAVFIIQITGALNTGAATSRVSLTGGARAANVFWQISGAVTLGAGSSFKGTVLGLAAITVGAGATIEGKALSIDGAVTLASNSVAD